MPRGPRLDYPDALHHVMVRGIQRKYIFDDPIDKDYFLEYISDSLQHTGCSCYAWCLMGNHGHFLLRSGPRGLAPLMRSLLTRYARWYMPLLRVGKFSLAALVRRGRTDPRIQAHDPADFFSRING